MSFNIPSSIALELVPRNLELFIEESRSNLAAYPFIEKINVPEILSVPIKSYEASKALLQAGISVVPHFRLIDRPIDVLKNMVAELVDLGLKELLLIGGDPPKNIEFEPSGVTTVQAIQSIRGAFPALKIYAGLDPYRSSFRKEIDYAMQKLEAGADGFYTQPFFSLTSLDLWLEQLKGVDMWFGLSPVYSEKSRLYWERVNQAVFPVDFNYGLAENRTLARQLLNRIAEAKAKAYFMPITISAKDYLADLFQND